MKISQDVKLFGSIPVASAAAAGCGYLGCWALTALNIAVNPIAGAIAAGTTVAIASTVNAVWTRILGRKAPAFLTPLVSVAGSVAGITAGVAVAGALGFSLTLKAALITAAATGAVATLAAAVVVLGVLVPVYFCCCKKKHAVQEKPVEAAAQA